MTYENIVCDQAYRVRIRLPPCVSVRDGWQLERAMRAIGNQKLAREMDQAELPGTELQRALRLLGACVPARIWVDDMTLDEVWLNPDLPDECRDWAISRLELAPSATSTEVADAVFTLTGVVL